MILRNEVLTHLETLEVDDFYDMRHKVVFQAIRNLESTAKPIDVVTLENEIEKPPGDVDGGCSSGAGAGPGMLVVFLGALSRRRRRATAP